MKSGYYQDIDRRYNGQFELVIQSGINPLFRNSSFEDFILDFDVLNIPFSIIPPTIYYELIEKSNIPHLLAYVYYIGFIKT